jgi:predicted RNase H-like HicB family nuclease
LQRFLVLIEPTRTGFSAYSPDLPGCMATGASRPDVEQGMREAIAFHLEGLRAEGQPIPPGGTSVTYVEVAA